MLRGMALRVSLVSLGLAPAVPLALYYLRAHLQAHAPEHAVTIHSQESPATWDAVVDALAAAPPDVVGFTCHLWSMPRVRVLAARIKARWPACRVILGGPEVSPQAQATLEGCPAADAVVRGEGEETFTEWMAALSSGVTDWSTIAGLSWRTPTGATDNPDRVPVADLDQLPSPFREDLVGPDPVRIVPLETQRGCTFKCGFCFYGKGFGAVRRYSLERVFQDLEHLLSRPCGGVYLMDPTFNLPVERAKRILRHIIAHNQHRTTFQTEIRAELVDQELAELLHRARVTKVEVGLQTIHPGVLRTVHRRLDRARFEEGMTQLARCRVGTEVQLIAGLPGDTWDGLMESARYVRRRFPFARLAVFPFLALPGTDLRVRAEALGLRYQPEPPYRVLETPSMTAQELRWSALYAAAVEGLERAAPAVTSVRSRLGWAPSALVQAFLEWLDGEGVLPEHLLNVAGALDAVRRFLDAVCTEAGASAEPHRTWIAQALPP